MKNHGFTLVEVLLSLGLFIYIFTALISVYIYFSKSLLSFSQNTQCSDFSMLIIQKLLTEANDFNISSTSDEVLIDDNILQIENGLLYLFKESERATSSKTDYILYDCGKTNIFFKKVSNSPNNFINSSKCLEIGNASSSKTVCAFR